MYYWRITCLCYSSLFSATESSRELNLNIHVNIQWVIIFLLMIFFSHVLPPPPSLFLPPSLSMLKVSQTGHVCIYCVSTILVPWAYSLCKLMFSLTGKLASVKPVTFSVVFACLSVVVVSLCFPHSLLALLFHFFLFICSEVLSVLHLSAAWGVGHNH